MPKLKPKVRRNIYPNLRGVGQEAPKVSLKCAINYTRRNLGFFFEAMRNHAKPVGN